MQGYCQSCGQIVDMENVQTVRLPNLSFIQKGVCSRKDCLGVIFKLIEDHEIIINAAGHKFPREVYVGPETPRKLFEKDNGQTIFKANEIVRTKLNNDQIKTVKEVKEKLDGR